MAITLYGTTEQRDLVQCKARRIALIAGRRWGKGFGCRNRALSKVFRRKNIKYLWGAPTYSGIIDEYEKMTLHNELRTLIHSYSKQPHPFIRFVNGSVIHYRSLDRPYTLRGGEYHEALIDEAQSVKDLEDIIDSIIAPCLSSLFGDLILAGQWDSLNYIYENFYLSAKDDPDTECFVFPSSSSVVFKSDRGKRELEAIKSRTPKLIYDQEYEVKPGVNSKNVFSHIEENTISGQYRELDPNGSFVAGLDLGQFEDHAALTVFDCNAQAFIYSYLFPLQDHELTARKAGELLNRFNNPTCIMDSTGGATGGHHKPDEFTKHYQDHIRNLRAYFWNQSNKNKMINNFSLGLEKGGIKIDEKNEQLIKQLKSYEYKRKKTTGQYEFQGPGGKNDDLVASALMAYEGYTRGWFSNGKGVPMSNLLNSIGG